MDIEIRRAFETIPDPVLVTDERGRILFSNPAADGLLGNGGLGLTDGYLSDVLPVENPVDLLDDRQPRIPAGSTGVVEALGSAAGQVFVKARATGWRTANGERRYTVLLHDMTARHIEETQLRATLECWDHALTGARIGVFELDVTTGRSTVSATWKRLMGFGEDDGLDAQAVWLSRIHPDDLPLVLAADQACIEGHSQRSLMEYRMRAGGGKGWRWMCSDAVAASRDASGKALRLIGTQTDITEKKEAEDLLRLSMRQFQSAFENAPIAKAVVGLDGRWLWVNAAVCDLLGYTERQLLQTDFQTLTHPEDIDADLEEIRQLLAGARSHYDMEKRYIRSDGMVVWGHLSVALVKDETGAPLHFISQIVDITEQRELARMKSEFVATVSHELRTPLTSILGAIGLLTSSAPEELSDEANRLLYIAEQNGKRLSDLINDILDFEKYSSGQVQLDISQERIPDLLEETVLANLPYADKFGVRFVLDAVDRSLRCAVDRRGFQQIMANLLSNAAKFADEGSAIRVGAEPAGGFVRISVVNQGAGIPAESRDALFQPFSQIERSSSRKRGGTGLGLSICRQIVEQLGGEIGFESQDGTTRFWFTVPAE